MVASERTPARRRATDDPVRVWSEVGMTIPVGDTMAFIKFTFGHERISPNGTATALKKTAADIDEFNEAEVERRVRHYTRLVVASMSDEEDQAKEDTRSRVRRKARGG